jgi:hypothetical protein
MYARLGHSDSGISFVDFGFIGLVFTKRDFISCRKTAGFICLHEFNTPSFYTSGMDAGTKNKNST